VWALAQSRGDGHRSLVTPERVLNEYNKDLIFFFLTKTSQRFHPFYSHVLIIIQYYSKIICVAAALGNAIVENQSVER